MPKVMLINVTHSEESRVGIMNDRVLESFEIESLSRAHLKGNIYKGVVHRIHPALEAAFVDIGAERDAFLPLDEICFNNLEDDPKASSRNGSGGRSQLRIRDVLRPGQEVLVQITKEQFANKPPTLSTFYSLPGRYLVLLPGSEDTGISRRIEGEERDRLRKVVDDLKPDSGFGLIVRTVAGLEDNGQELSRDLDYLKRLWNNVQDASHGRSAPSLIYREHDIVQRAIRDFYTPDISEIYIDDEDVYQRAREFLRAIMPGSESVLRLYRGEQPLFSAFSVEEQIESVFGRRVRLKSGGSIVIDGTEALTAIDVNSGGAVRGANPEETAFKTNREAAAEVARQLRLRDIGGIIVVDFIDMRDPRHNREIEQLMRDEMRLDKARHETSRLSSLGLMQISRQRLRPAAGATSHITCPLCQGYGSVRTHGSAALGAIRKIHDRLSLGDVDTLTVTLPTDVGLYVLNQKREDLANLESRYESTVEVRLSGELLPHEIETSVKERSRSTSPSKPSATGGIVEAAAESARSSANGAEGGDGNKRRRRRRRKRGGRGGDNGTTAEESSTEASSESAAASGGAAGEGASADEKDAKGESPDRRKPETSDDSQPRPASDASSGDAADGTPEGDRPAQAEKREDGAPSRGRRSRGRRGGRRRRGGSQAANGDREASNTRQAQETDRSPDARAASNGAPAPGASDGDKTTTADSTRPSRDESSERRDAAGAASKPPAGESPPAGPPSPAKTDAPAAEVTSPSAAPTPETAKPAAKKAAAKKTTTKKVAAKKSTTKKAAAKKTTKKTATKKTTKKAATKKTTAKKTTKKTAAKKKPATADD